MDGDFIGLDEILSAYGLYFQYPTATQNFKCIMTENSELEQHVEVPASYIFHESNNDKDQFVKVVSTINRPYGAVPLNLVLQYPKDIVHKSKGELKNKGLHLFTPEWLLLQKSVVAFFHIVQFPADETGMCYRAVHSNYVKVTKIDQKKVDEFLGKIHE